MTLSTGLVASYIEHLGLPAAPEPTLDTLTQLYARWCAKVPYDNGRIRRSLTENPDGEVIGVAPAQLLADNMTDGNSSQCTETAGALYALLLAMGFEAELVLAYYGATAQPPAQLNHISVVVSFGEDRYLVDTVLLSGAPIPLREHEKTYPPLVYTVSHDSVGSWRIDTVTPVARVPVTARLFCATSDAGVCAAIYHAVQDEGFADFNATFYGRRNVDGEMITFSTSGSDRSLSSLHRSTISGTISVECRTEEQRAEALREGLGLSESFVKSLPANAVLPATAAAGQ